MLQVIRFCCLHADLTTKMTIKKVNRYFYKGRCGCKHLRRCRPVGKNTKSQKGYKQYKYQQLVKGVYFCEVNGNKAQFVKQ